MVAALMHAPAQRVVARAVRMHGLCSCGRAAAPAGGASALGAAARWRTHRTAGPRRASEACPCPSREGAAARLCTAAPPPATARERDAVLQWVAPDNRKEISRILEIADRAVDRWDLTFTPFLPPPVVADAMAALSGRVDVMVVPWGGYAQAERCRLALGREDLLQPLAEAPDQLGGVAALEVKGNFMFDPAAHPDFLGAILGTGVVREKVGDILVQGESGAQILVDPELVEFFETNLTQVRTVTVTTKAMPLSQLNVRPPKVEEFSSVEASMRLDAIASAGFRLSRSKMGDLIKAGDVRINWRPASKPSVDIKEGDVISCTGKGRIEIRSVEMTKKEKYAVTLVRFV